MTAPEKHPVRISRYFYEFLKLECELVNPHVAEEYPDRQLAIEESIELGIQYPTVPAALRETKRHIWVDANDEHTPFLRREAIRWSRAQPTRKAGYEEDVYDCSPIENLSSLRRSAEVTRKVLGRTP